MKPNICLYLNYRQFLRHIYEYFKKTTPAFSLRFFAKKAGFSSSGYLSMVINGQRRLTMSSIAKFSKALNLTQNEREYFELLVFYNQADDLAEKEIFFKRLLAKKSQLDLSKLTKRELQFFSDAALETLLHIINLPDFQPDLNWIAKRFLPRVRTQKIKESLKTLEKLKLIKKTPQKNWQQTQNFLKPQTKIKTFAKLCHDLSIINLAKKSLLSLPNHNHQAKALTLSLSKKRARELEDKIFNFYNEILTWLNQNDETENKEVYQLLFQMFPLTQKMVDG